MAWFDHSRGPDRQDDKAAAWEEMLGFVLQLLQVHRSLSGDLCSVRAQAFPQEVFGHPGTDGVGD